MLCKKEELELISKYKSEEEIMESLAISQNKYRIMMSKQAIKSNMAGRFDRLYREVLDIKASEEEEDVDDEIKQIKEIVFELRQRKGWAVNVELSVSL